MRAKRKPELGFRIRGTAGNENQEEATGLKPRKDMNKSYTRVRILLEYPQHIQKTSYTILPTPSKLVIGRSEHAWERPHLFPVPLRSVPTQ
jgi:hypothetical protein